MSKGHIDRALIIGANGGFGRAFSAKLSDSGVQIVSADVSGDVDVRGDLLEAPDLFSDHLDVDLILSCVPQEAAMPILESLDGRAPEGALLVDICSVKTPICSLAQNHAVQCEYLSLHPMFAPHRDFTGANAVTIEIRGGTMTEQFKTLLRSWGLSLIDADAEGHDRVTSLVQVVTHAMLASFANARDRMGVDDALLDAFATPNYAELDSLAQKMLGENPSLYHNMQTQNPFAQDAHDAMRDALAQTLAAFQADDSTRSMFARLKR